MADLYTDISFKTSRIVTRSYSTSFSKAVSFLDPDIRDAVYALYGFVRLADEIVDTFHDFNKEYLLDNFEKEFDNSLSMGISLNPVLNSFIITINKYKIDDDLIRAFLKSMKIDLFKSDHKSREETDEYIYGSAEVVGLMCLKIFVKGDTKLYKELLSPARKLGAAFQKVNFLRDIKNDTELLNRKYFHDLVGNKFDESLKLQLTEEIESDFRESVPGIRKLPGNSKLGVLIAYFYYRKLLNIIRKTPADTLLEKRVRVPDFTKIILLIKAWLVNVFKLM